MPNRAEVLIHYLACLRAGLVATPLNYRYMAPEIDHALEVAAPALLLAHAERGEDLAKSRLTGRLPRGRITYGDDAGTALRLEHLIAQEPPAWDRPKAAPCDPAVIFFTSGSTGPPKGVTHSCESLGWTLAGFSASFAVTPNDIMLPASSLSHGGGYKMSLAGLSIGARVGVARSRDAGYMLPLLREIRPTYLHMLPAALFSLVRDQRAARDDFRSLRLATSAGDKVADELRKEFAALTGLELREGYGMTEIGPAAMPNPDGALQAWLGRAGRPRLHPVASRRGGQRGAERPGRPALGEVALQHDRLLGR